MRWDELRIDSEEGRTLPGYREPAAVRTFDAPEALDTRFYEVRSKSVLNRVPKGSRMPFRWTINPYRGCSHACVYCLEGDTPVLMADGSTRPIARLRPGDVVCGTERRGASRRCTPTEVLDRWCTRKPAHRVTLEDGTELVASADHRFLTDHGRWKHVAGGEGGEDRRPRLTPGDALVGVGALEGAHGALEPGAGIGVKAVEPLGKELPLHDITTGTGDFIANGVVSHNCFARPTHAYLGLSPGRDFEREIVVKLNAPEVARAELARPSWRREHVAMGTNTDPYQWVESRYRLMPGILEALRDSGTPASVLTKSPLLLRDAELFRQVPGFQANLSVPTLDERAWRAGEPRTPHPRKRLEAVAELNAAGIPCGILIAPLMPGINDSPEQVERIIEIATDAGATAIGGIGLHLRGEVRELFLDWLRSQRPDLVQRYERLYRRGAYLPAAERERLAGLARGPGRTGRRERLRGVLQAPADDAGERAGGPAQASLF